MIAYREVVKALHDLGLRGSGRVVAHASRAAYAPIAGGADSLVGALLATCETLLMPAFTFRTMVTPAVGPPGNALEYGEATARNAQAEIFRPDLPVDDPPGEIAERLRLHPRARRSGHPLLSFCGVGAEEALARQTLEEPLAPIAWLAEYDGDVLLFGVDHRANLSLHLAERVAGRRQFVRWALTPAGVVECPRIPGCSVGFGAMSARLTGVALSEQLGEAALELVPLRDLLHLAAGWIREDPEALLCRRRDCERCGAVRTGLETQASGSKALAADDR